MGWLSLHATGPRPVACRLMLCWAVGKWLPSSPTLPDAGALALGPGCHWAESRAGDSPVTDISRVQTVSGFCLFKKKKEKKRYNRFTENVLHWMIRG